MGNDKELKHSILTSTPKPKGKEKQKQTDKRLRQTRTLKPTEQPLVSSKVVASFLYSVMF